MALPSFLQAMFTPARSGSYQWQNRPDQGGGEFTGEIEGVYEGDAQDLIFKPRAHRGPGNTVGQKMPDATNATTGLGQSATQDMMDAVKATGLGGDYDSAGMDSGLSSMTGLEPGISSSITETALEPGGMSSISEIMQGQAGEMSPMGYAQPSYSMRDEFAEEGPGMLSQGPSMGTIPRHSNAHGFVGGGAPGSVGGMTGVPLPEHGGWATPLYDPSNPFGIGSGMMGDQGLTDVREVTRPAYLGGNVSGVGDQGNFPREINAQQGVSQLAKILNFLAPSLYKGQGISEAPIARSTQRIPRGGGRFARR